MHSTRNIHKIFRDTPFWICAFTLFCLTYGFLGDPTPTTINFISIFWIGFLVLSFSWQNLPNIKSFSAFKIAAISVFTFGLIAPLIVGALSGHDFILMSRDILSYLFVFIGFLYILTFNEKRTQTIKVFLGGLLIIALAMALRRLGLMPYGLDRASVFEDPFALSVVPEILFGAIFLISFAILNFLKTDKSVFNQTATFIGLILMASPLLAVMHMSVMRAGIGMVFIATLISLSILLLNRPYVAMFLSAIFAGGVMVLLKPLNAVFQLFWLKTVMIGTNNRLLEIKVVLQDVLSNPVSFVLGKGWGTVINNPAVGGEQVLYTHSLLSSSLLKGGFLMTILISVYLLWLFTGIFKQLFKEKRPLYISLYLAISMTLLVNILIYGGYKTIGFGVVIALAMGMVSCYGQYSRQNDINRH